MANLTEQKYRAGKKSGASLKIRLLALPTRLEKTSMDKRSSSLGPFVSYEENDVLTPINYVRIFVQGILITVPLTCLTGLD
jgi:hypothetical protein